MTKDDKAIKWTDRLNAYSTVAIAVCTLVNLGVSYGLWRATIDATDVTRSIYEAANRPYLGSDGFEVHNDKKVGSLLITSNVKNFGSVPATGEMKWQWFVDGKEEKPTGGVSNGPVIVFPGQGVHTNIQFGLDLYKAVIEGRSIVRVRISSKYRGASEKIYEYCEDEQYIANQNGFGAIGSCL